jgi:hypothetical protein
MMLSEGFIHAFAILHSKIKRASTVFHFLFGFYQKGIIKLIHSGNSLVEKNYFGNRNPLG